ncbi:MAG TPA: hypothetical protein VFZ95_14360 [Steroidobacteraceae bacterium]
MRARLLCAIVLVAGAGPVFAQGCIVARGAGMPAVQFGSSPVNAHQDKIHARKDTSAPKFDFAVGYRSFESWRHFVGTEEQKERQEEGSQVINNSRFVDLSLTYRINDRYFVSLSVPYVDHDRSQVVRDNTPQRNILERFHTQASGFGDLRLTGYMWARNPTPEIRTNLLVGLGVDTPTGDDDVYDNFKAYNPATKSIVTRRQTVDQSIQPGDGGWGAIIDLYGYHRISDAVTLYASGVYTLTPEETSGVPTYRSNPYESEMSIGDSYLVRLGTDFAFGESRSFVLSLGGRWEGVPVEDFIGGSQGFRRPGYTVSVELGGTYDFRNGFSAGIYADAAVQRNRQRSVADRQLTEASGVYRHGDAAFADHVLMASVKKQF